MIDKNNDNTGITKKTFVYSSSIKPLPTGKTSSEYLYTDREA